MFQLLVTSRSFGKTSEYSLGILKEHGVGVKLFGTDFDQEAFEGMIPQYDALIIGAHPFSAEVMGRCKKLKLIAKHGAGLDNIDLEAAKKMGIAVTNVPATNANAVADLAMGLILNASRGISLCAQRVRRGEWKTFTGRDGYKKTLGLVGFGSIARNVALRALGFDMQVLAYDPFLAEIPKEFQGKVILADLDELIETSNIISIHVPLTPETKGLFSEKTLWRMKKDAVLVNTARGGIVDEDALYNVMSQGHLLGAALDVLETEPIAPDNKLIQLENVVITPHIGMYSLEAMSAVSDVCADNVVSCFLGRTLKNQVV